MIQQDIHIIIDEPQFEQRIKVLAERLQPINEWTEQDILQFGITAFQSYFMPTILALMENIVDDMEQESC